MVRIARAQRGCVPLRHHAVTALPTTAGACRLARVLSRHYGGDLQRTVRTVHQEPEITNVQALPVAANNHAKRLSCPAQIYLAKKAVNIDSLPRQLLRARIVNADVPYAGGLGSGVQVGRNTGGPLEALRVRQQPTYLADFTFYSVNTEVRRCSSVVLCAQLRLGLFSTYTGP